MNLKKLGMFKKIKQANMNSELIFLFMRKESFDLV